MALNDEFPVAQAIAKLNPKREEPVLLGSTPGHSRMEMFKAVQWPTPALLRQPGKDGNSYFKQASSVRGIIT